MSTRGRRRVDEPGASRHFRRSSRGLGRADRGAIAVEAAVASTILVFLLFGVLEMGALLRTRTQVTDATREAARVAASQPRVDGWQNSALAAVTGVAGDSASSPIDTVTIYRADPDTGMPASGEPIESCLVDCWRYVWTGSGWQQRLGATWEGATQLACGGIDDTDWVGVHITGHHDWITGILGGSRSLSDRTIMRLEPIIEGSRCRP